MRNRLQQVLLSTTTQTLNLSYPCPPLRIPTKKKQSRHLHVDQVIKIISVVVVYEQGVGLKSSITVDTASRKDLTLQGCTNCPLQGSAHTPISLSCYPSQATIL